MLLIAFVLLFLAIVKKFEPLLLLPIAFGMLLTNLPGAEMFHSELFAGGHVHWDLFGGATVIHTGDISKELFQMAGNKLSVLQSGDVLVGGTIIGHITDVSITANAFINSAGAIVDAAGKTIAENASIAVDLAGSHISNGMLYLGSTVVANNASVVSAGLLDYLYLGVKLGIYPCLIFFGVGAMTDFEPLIANPKSLLLGAAAQIGIFVTFIGCTLMGFTGAQAGSTGIIGGADGPTAIFVTSKLAPELLGPIAVAAYSYMALVPVIQPPIMKLITTKKERQIVMKPLRSVSKTEKIIFPIVITVFVALLVPSAAP
ncbi:MAG: sodium ion-translocating decarboxylase subunit beta, partial [Clostridia bacterium]|nr:sodium ion-translocating decarboxylase subunit beta [Clostridia bacterium]